MRVSGYAGEARSTRKFSDEAMKDALHAAANGSNKPLSREAYQTYYETHRDRPHPYTIIRRFDRWSTALQKAGLPHQKRAAYQSRISKDDCVKALLDAREILGHLPSVGEYEELWHQSFKEAGKPSGSTIRLKFDKWRDACTAAAAQVK